MTARWCPSCRRELPEPPLSPREGYRKFWVEDLCYVCDSPLRPLHESPSTAKPAAVHHESEERTGKRAQGSKPTPESASMPIAPGVQMWIDGVLKPTAQSSPAAPVRPIVAGPPSEPQSVPTSAGEPLLLQIPQHLIKRGDLATRSPQIEAEKTHNEILNAYLAEKDLRTKFSVLIRGVVELIQHGKVSEGINLLNIGHTILVHSGVTPDANPYVTFFAKARLYCWVCNRFMATADGKLKPGTFRSLFYQCTNCKKTFCPSHAAKRLFSGAKCPLCKSTTSIGPRIPDRYFVTLAAITSGILFAFFSNVSVTSPQSVLSAPDSFISTPFEFRYVDLARAQVITDDSERTVVMLDLSVQSQSFKVYGAVPHAVLQKLNRSHRLFLVRGNYEKKSDRYVLSDVTVPYGLLGSVTAVFYQATKLVFNHRLAVMTASFGIWFVASAIWTLFKMVVPEEIGDLADIGKDIIE